MSSIFPRDSLLQRLAAVDRFAVLAAVDAVNAKLAECSALPLTLDLVELVPCPKVRSEVVRLLGEAGYRVEERPQPQGRPLFVIH